MINGQVSRPFTTVLAGVIITPENLPAGQFDLETRAVNHVLQPNDRGARKGRSSGVNLSPSIHHHGCLVCQNQTNRTAQVADIDWLEIGVEYKHIIRHCDLTCKIIAPPFYNRYEKWVKKC